MTATYTSATVTATAIYQFGMVPLIAQATKYVVSTDTWSYVSKPPTTRSGAAGGVGGVGAAATVGNTMYLCGGEGPAGAVVEAYSPLVDTWMTKNAMPSAHQGPAVMTCHQCHRRR